MEDSPLSLILSLSQLLTLSWLIMLVVYIIFSLIFVYHWRAYASDAAVSRRTLLTYFIGSGSAMAIAGLSIFFL